MMELRLIQVLHQTLLTLSTGVENTAFGYQALVSNSTAVRNTAVGAFALNSNTTGVTNVANEFVINPLV